MLLGLGNGLGNRKEGEEETRRRKESYNTLIVLLGITKTWSSINLVFKLQEPPEQ